MKITEINNKECGAMAIEADAKELNEKYNRAGESPKGSLNRCWMNGERQGRLRIAKDFLKHIYNQNILLIHLSFFKIRQNTINRYKDIM